VLKITIREIDTILAGRGVTATCGVLLMKRVFLGTVLCFFLAGPAMSFSITPAAFGSGAIVENFEGLTVGPNVGTSPFGNILEPGITGPYTFSSGVTLTAPVPNPGTMNDGVFVQDFALGNSASNNWAGNGSVSSAANVPFSTAYLGAFDNIGGDTQPVSFRLTFASDVLAVGAYVTGIPTTNVRLDAYNASNNLLESVTVGTVPVSQWGTNFIGLEQAAGIRSIAFTAIDFGIADLTFQPVPEPSSAMLLAVGILGLVFAGRPRNPRGANKWLATQTYSGGNDAFTSEGVSGA